MMLILLILYAFGISFFCLNTLLDPEERAEIRGPLAWHFAIVLPIITIAGGFLHYFEPAVSSSMYYGFLVLWLSALAAVVYEVSTLETFEGGVTPSSVLLGILMLGILFGPGLFLGSVWLRMTPH